ncbi:unnamed protein product [Dibothriocephalus latus]|uniref:Uncharacterized protein n=1 Tax=Dibothriocephalus latus TaxID=60516 RepID=A0A3P7N2V7_DIBLA|nr:unnamed protein product [Dibothriocephalus latus]
MLMGRVPKRRAQPTPEPPDMLEDEVQLPASTADAEVDTSPSTLLLSPVCTNGRTGSRVHTRPRCERVCQALQQSPSAITEANEDQLPTNEPNSRKPSDPQVISEASNSAAKATSGDVSTWWTGFEATTNYNTNILAPDQPSPYQSSNQDELTIAGVPPERFHLRSRLPAVGPAYFLHLTYYSVLSRC